DSPDAHLTSNLGASGCSFWATPTAIGESISGQGADRLGAIPGSGRLSGAGFDAVADDWFRLLDRNGDGLLDLIELPSDLRAELLRWDVNARGFASAAEFRQFVRSRAASADSSLASWFEKLDADGGGLISLSEWQAAGGTAEVFRRLDRTEQGFLAL